MMSTTTLQGPYVFLSYHRDDGEDGAKRIEQDLRVLGFQVWRDESSINPGNPDWEEAIREAISHAYAVVLIASPGVIKSPYIKAELIIANEYHSKHIYPIWMKGERWSQCVPMYFINSQYIDMREGKYDEGLKALVKELQKVKERSSLPPPPPQPDVKLPVQPPSPLQPDFEPPPPPPRRRRFLRGCVVAVGLVLLLIVISIIGIMFAHSRAIASNYPFSDDLVLNDPLSHYNDIANAPWDNFTQTDSGCNFTGGAYHAYENSTNGSLACMVKASHYSNFTYEVQMTILKGDCGGIDFRSDYQHSKYYQFEVCQNGDYYLNLQLDGSHVTTLLNNASKLINQGLNQSNLLAVEVKGQSIYLYVNKQLIDKTSDKTYSSGQIGVTADPDLGNPTEVVYKNAKVWSL